MFFVFSLGVFLVSFRILVGVFVESVWRFVVVVFVFSPGFCLESFISCV